MIYNVIIPRDNYTSFANPVSFYNRNLKMSSFKSSEIIQKKEGGPDRSVSDNQSSSVTLNELALKAKITYCNFEFQQRSHTKTNMKIQIGFKWLKLFRINESKPIIFSEFSEYFYWSQRTKSKIKLHYGRCTGSLNRAAARHNTSCSDNK